MHYNINGNNQKKMLLDGNKNVEQNQNTSNHITSGNWEQRQQQQYNQ